MAYTRGSKRAEADKRYNETTRQHHPDLLFWKSREWRDHLRPQQLKRAPWCEECHARGTTTPARQVDHRVPPKGDATLQRDPANLRSLCASCHARKTQADQRGFSLQIDQDGYPTDPRHPANQERGHYPPRGKRK
jgi:5-methylcytosine-specific restriction protein A